MILFMKNSFLKMVALFSVYFLCSCADNKPVEPEKVEEAERDRMVARVASVNIAAKYVLIQRYGRLDIPEDSILYTLGTDSGEGSHSANIKVTGERLGQFLAADIVSGDLTVGDAVYLRVFEEKRLSDSQ